MEQFKTAIQGVSNKTAPRQLDLFETEIIPNVSGAELSIVEKARLQAKEELENKYTYTDIAKKSISLATTNTVLQQFGREDLAPDPDFNPSAEYFNKVAVDNDIPIQHMDAFEEAQSEAHLQQIIGRIKEIQGKEEIINSKGIAVGITSRILAEILDPVAITATIATEGVIAPLVLMNKLARGQRFIRGALAGASSNMAIEGYLMSQNPTMDVDDVLFAGLFGFGLGGSISAARRTNLDEAAFYEQVQKGAIKEDIKNQGLELTENGAKELGENPNQRFNSTRTEEDVADPLDSIDGKLRDDGIRETRITEGQEYMHKTNPDGTIEVRRCK
jgi:hypothetical protein